MKIISATCLGGNFNRTHYNKDYLNLTHGNDQVSAYLASFSLICNKLQVGGWGVAALKLGNIQHMAISLAVALQRGGIKDDGNPKSKEPS